MLRKFLKIFGPLECLTYFLKFNVIFCKISFIKIKVNFFLKNSFPLEQKRRFFAKTFSILIFSIIFTKPFVDLKPNFLHHRVLKSLQINFITTRYFPLIDTMQKNQDRRKSSNNGDDDESETHRSLCFWTTQTKKAT